MKCGYLPFDSHCCALGSLVEYDVLFHFVFSYTWSAFYGAHCAFCSLLLEDFSFHLYVSRDNEERMQMK